MFAPISNSITMNLASLLKNDPSFGSILGDSTVSIDPENWETNTTAILNKLVQIQRERAEIEERAKARFNQQIISLMAVSPISALSSVQEQENDLAAAILRAQASLQLQELQQQQMVTDRIKSLLYNSSMPSIPASPASTGLGMLTDQELENLARMQAMRQQQEQAPQSPESKRKGRVGAFPQKLHRMLLELEASGQADVACFLPNMPGFIIRKPKEFAKQIMPKYFQGMSRFSSFQRQLNLYDFVRIHTGPDRGAYCHDLFVKNQPVLCTMMQRNKIKSLNKEVETSSK